MAEEFPDQLLLVLDGGASEVGIESTIIDVSGAAPRVLRPGRVRAGDIERVLGVPAWRGPLTTRRACPARWHHTTRRVRRR